VIVFQEPFEERALEMNAEVPNLYECNVVHKVNGKRITMDRFMQAAIDEARKGYDAGGVPIGSVLVHRGIIIGRGHNQRQQRGSAILHGEMDALENAGRLAAHVYREAVLYTTLSPCAMCSGAILLYGIPEIVIGENSTFQGEETLLRQRGVTLTVYDDPQCKALMERFIVERPEIWYEDIGESGM
jgi:cytosine deaminase